MFLVSMSHRRERVVILCLSAAVVMLVHHRLKATPTCVEKKNHNSQEASIIQVPVMYERKFLDARATRWTSDKAFHRYLTSPDVKCNKSFRAGEKGDGGWDICLTKPFLLKPPCLVYSFGIAYRFTFDDAVANKFHCTVRSFDPSMKRARNHQRGKHIHFFKDGISGKDFTNQLGWNLYSLATIVKTHNDSNTIIDYLKMDVEKSEWDALPDMAVKGTLNNIKQIGIEIHREIGETKAVHLIDILEDHGFRKWKMNYNFHCGYKMADGTRTSYCLELYYINTRFIDSRQRNSFMLDNFKAI